MNVLSFICVNITIWKILAEFDVQAVVITDSVWYVSKGKTNVLMYLNPMQV